MNFFSRFSSVAGAPAKPPRRPRLVCVWVIDPRTGKPRRVWRLADSEGSCTRRPGGPLHRIAPLKRAA
jgi:hypothetical protein